LVGFTYPWRALRLERPLRHPGEHHHVRDSGHDETDDDEMQQIDRSTFHRAGGG